MKQQQPQKGVTYSDALGILYWLAYSHATCFTVLIRRNFGVEGLGLNAILALLIMLLYWGCAAEPMMLPYIALWFFVLICQRLQTWSLVRKGWAAHSHHAGDPAVAMLLTKNEKIARDMVEPGLCLAVGIALLPVSQQFGLFVMAGYFSLTLQRGIESQRNMMRARRMKDAVIEQRYLSDLAHGRRDDY